MLLNLISSIFAGCVRVRTNWICIRHGFRRNQFFSQLMAIGHTNILAKWTDWKAVVMILLRWVILFKNSTLPVAHSIFISISINFAVIRLACFCYPCFVRTERFFSCELCPLINEQKWNSMEEFGGFDEWARRCKYKQTQTKRFNRME